MPVGCGEADGGGAYRVRRDGRPAEGEEDEGESDEGEPRTPWRSLRLLSIQIVLVPGATPQGGRHRLQGLSIASLITRPCNRLTPEEQKRASKEAKRGRKREAEKRKKQGKALTEGIESMNFGKGRGRWSEPMLRDRPRQEVEA